MFFHKTSLKPTPTKKIIYIVLNVILGLLLGFLVHVFIEIKYLEWAASTGYYVVWQGNCALPLILQVGLLFLGAVGGFFSGKFWWKKVYIERFWEKKLTK
jgi:uncharacterized protein YneF (UPF0154 family)